MRALLLTTLALVAVAGCRAGAPVPARPSPPPAAVADTAAAEAPVARGPWRFGATDVPLRYTLVQETRLADMAARGRGDSGTAFRTARADLRLTRTAGPDTGVPRPTAVPLGTLDVSGAVSALVVEASPAVAYRPPRTPSVDSVRATGRDSAGRDSADRDSADRDSADRDSADRVTSLRLPHVAVRALVEGDRVRIVAQPLLVNECDAPEVAALELVRPLLVRLPTFVAVGDRWEERALTLTCRGDVPTTLQATTAWQVLGAWRARDGVPPSAGGPALLAAPAAGAGPAMPRAWFDTLHAAFVEEVRALDAGARVEAREDATWLVLAYSRRTTATGDRTTRWERRAISAALDGAGYVLVDVARGVPLVVVGRSEGPITLTLGSPDTVPTPATDAARPDTTTRTITQSVTVRVRLVPEGDERGGR